jgi:hypothetical protein
MLRGECLDVAALGGGGFFFWALLRCGPEWFNENPSQQGLHIPPASACCYLRAASWVSKQSENATDFARNPLEREGKSWLNVGICMGNLF